MVFYWLFAVAYNVIYIKKCAFETLLWGWKVLEYQEIKKLTKDNSACLCQSQLWLHAVLHLQLLFLAHEYCQIISIPVHHTSFFSGWYFLCFGGCPEYTKWDAKGKKNLRPGSVKFSRTVTENPEKILIPALIWTATGCRWVTLKSFFLEKKISNVPSEKCIFLPLGFSPGQLPEAYVLATLLWEKSRADGIHFLS